MDKSGKKGNIVTAGQSLARGQYASKCLSFPMAPLLSLIFHCIALIADREGEGR